MKRAAVLALAIVAIVALVVLGVTTATRARTKLTMLLVTHDMRLARALAHEAWIMKDG